jgi:hypothetical protein
MDIIELPVAPEAALSGGIAPSPDRPLPPAVADELARLRMIVNSALDYAIITLDLTGRVTGWNHGAERLTGYPAVEVLGGPGDLLFTAKDRAEGAFTAEMCCAMESGRAANERWPCAAMAAASGRAASCSRSAGPTARSRASSTSCVTAPTATVKPSAAAHPVRDEPPAEERLRHRPRRRVPRRDTTS